jgi:tetratricopeptide (TPR) repeat protein
MASLKEAHLIIKLHGDDTSAILHRDTVATIDQVLRSFPRSARVRLTNVVKGRPLLVIGYAARDPDIAPFLRDIVRNSPMVVWVGRGALSPRITAILQNHPRAIYLSDGFESSIAGRLGAEGIDAAMAISEWHRRLKRWARIGNRKMLLRFLADVAEALNTPESRRIAERLLTEAYTGEPASIERFQLQMEILYRASPRPIRKIKRQLALYGRRFGEVNVDRNTRIIQLTRLATAWQRYGNYSKAEKLLRRALLMSKSAREFSSRYNVQRAFGRFAAFRGGELFSEGLASLRVARSLAARRDAQIEATDAAEDMAICLMRQDRAAEAERILQRCHQVEQEIGNPSRLLNWGINLAESYRIQRKFSLALSELERLRESSGISGDFEQQIKVFGNSALTAICAGKPAMANRWSAIAFRIAGGRPMDEMVANMQYNQGWMRLSLGAWRDAIRFFIDSAATCRRYGGPERTAGALACAGWCCLELGEKRSARARLAEIKDLRIKAMGLHAPEIKVLEVFLESASWDECLDRCRHELAGAHDQLFRGVAYVYERASERMTDQARERCARILVSSALKSKMAFLCARAAAVLSKHGNASRSLARLRKERFRPLRSYLTELNRS